MGLVRGAECREKETCPGRGCREKGTCSGRWNSEGDSSGEADVGRWRFVGGGKCREEETCPGRQVSGEEDLSREVGVERRVLSGEAGVGHSDAVIRPVEMVLESLPQCWL